jgi:hypothetical protein
MNKNFLAQYFPATGYCEGILKQVELRLSNFGIMNVVFDFSNFNITNRD